MSGDRLRLIVQTESETLDPIHGPQRHGVRLHLLVFELAQGGGGGRLVSFEPLPTQDLKEFAFAEFAVSKNAEFIVRMGEFEGEEIDGKAYASGLLQFMSRGEDGSFVVRRSWPRSAFFVSPSASKLIVREGDAPVAYELPALERVNPNGLKELFLAAGSDWEGGPAQPLPRVGADEPADYFGLTDDWDYGSADGGMTYARFVYDGQTRKRRAVPRLLDLPDGGHAAVRQVRKAEGRWVYLCRQFTGTDPARLIVDDEMKIVATLASQGDGPAMPESWNAVDGTVLLHRPLDPLKLSTLSCVVWHYKTNPTRVSTFDLDFSRLFHVEGDQFVPAMTKARAK